jgi:hypothetical protein
MQLDKIETIWAPKKYKVTVAVTVPAYATVEIEAESQAAAEQKITDEIDSCENAGVDVWASNFWQDLTFEPDWQQAEDFRIVE